MDSWSEGLPLPLCDLGDLTVVMVVSIRGGPSLLFGLGRLVAVMVVSTKGLSSLFLDLEGLTAVMVLWACFIWVSQDFSAPYE